MPNLTTKRGDTSAYGLACGYIQEWCLKEWKGATVMRVSLCKLHSNYVVDVYKIVQGSTIREQKFFTRIKEARTFVRNLLHK